MKWKNRKQPKLRKTKQLWVTISSNFSVTIQDTRWWKMFRQPMRVEACWNISTQQSWLWFWVRENHWSCCIVHRRAIDVVVCGLEWRKEIQGWFNWENGIFEGDGEWVRLIVDQWGSLDRRKQLCGFCHGCFWWGYGCWVGNGVKEMLKRCL